MDTSSMFRDLLIVDRCGAYVRLKVPARPPFCEDMVSFAELLVEATQRLDHGEVPASSPVADTVRAFEDRVASASVADALLRAPMWAQRVLSRPGASLCAARVRGEMVRGHSSSSRAEPVSIAARKGASSTFLLVA